MIRPPPTSPSLQPLAPLPEPPKPLPRAPGPKLAPFTPTARADIEFVQELGNPEIDRDGRVWKVRINGSQRYFALKLVSVPRADGMERLAKLGADHIPDMGRASSSPSIAPGTSR